MEELKTLKDMEFGRTEKEDREFLRQELIKWVKEPTRYLGDGEYQFINSGMRFRWHDLLKHIFNITKEELK